MVKTDAALKKDVEAELAWEPAVNAAAVGVSVQGGVVCLSGHLETYAEKLAVERAVRRVPGVRSVAIELDVKLAAGHQRSDAEIAASAEQLLKWQTVAPPEWVSVSVEQGWVTLRGTVEWEFQRRGIEKLLRPLMGVVGIHNELAIREKATPVNVAERIREALTRQAVREAHRVQVDVDGSTVKLRGRVHSWAERDAVAGAAWSAPGVQAVINELDVGPDQP